MRFRQLLSAAPEQVQLKADQVYRQWSVNPEHPSLRYKKVHASLPVYSVRIDRNWRAVGVLREETVIWFWIGAHNEYEKLLGNL